MLELKLNKCKPNLCSVLVLLRVLLTEPSIVCNLAPKRAMSSEATIVEAFVEADAPAVMLSLSRVVAGVDATVVGAVGGLALVEMSVSGLELSHKDAF